MAPATFDLYAEGQVGIGILRHDLRESLARAVCDFQDHLIAVLVSLRIVDACCCGTPSSRGKRPPLLEKNRLSVAEAERVACALNGVAMAGRQHRAIRKMTSSSFSVVARSENIQGRA